MTNACTDCFDFVCDSPKALLREEDSAVQARKWLPTEKVIGASKHLSNATRTRIQSRQKAYA